MAVAASKKHPAKKAGTSSKSKVKTFKWEGKDKQGKAVKGEMPSDTAALVKAQLRKQGIVATKVQRKSSLDFGSAASGKKIRPVDIATLSRQLATMMEAGVPLVQSLAIIAQGHDNPSMSQMVNAIKSDVEAGNSFGEALTRQPKYFDSLFCDLVIAGEQSGALEGMLDRVATYKEKAEKLKAKIKKALTYPIAVVIVAVIVTAILLIKVVPMFEKLFQGSGADLPAFTQLVVDISEWMQAWWFIGLLIIIGGMLAYKQAHFRSEKVRNGQDRALLKFPIIGSILHQAAIARFTRTLATTFAAGVPLVEALESAAGASGNVVYRRAILQIRDEVTTGVQMNHAMMNTGVFPNMVVQMVAIGEEAGSVDKMLNKVAEIYEEHVDNAVDQLSTLIEPLIMAFLGVVVGGLLIAMYMPIFSMGKAFG